MNRVDFRQLEPTPVNGVFRLRYVRGVYAQPGRDRIYIDVPERMALLGLSPLDCSPREVAGHALRALRAAGVEQLHIARLHGVPDAWKAAH